MRTHARVRVLALSSSVLVLAAAAACTTGNPAPPATTTTAAQTPTPSATPSVDAAAVAAVTDVMGRYIDAIVQMENSGQPDPAPLRDIAGDAIIDQEVLRVADLVKQGIHREGRPALGEPQVTVDGDTARFEVCMDQDDWVGVLGDQKVGSDYGPLPTGWDLSLVDGVWRVTADVATAEVSVTC